jgi:hypothetical protein
MGMQRRLYLKGQQAPFIKVSGGGIMSGYKYIKLNYMHSMIQIITADHKTMDWVIGEIQKNAPACRVYRGGELTRIDDLEGDEKKIGAWVIRVLCKEGWQPYAGTGPIDGTVWHHLRYRYDTHEF